MEAPPNPNKRLCKNPNSLPNVSDFNQNNVDLIISSFLSLPDSPSLSSSSLSIGCSFDRVLEKLFQASGDDESVTDRGLQLAWLLQESTKRCARKHLTLRNSVSWSLPHELTIQVFSNLDKKSLMQALSCCTMFKKCAMDPFCYSHIDLTTTAIEHANDGVLRTMIHRAGKELRSLKVGCVTCPNTSLLTGSCLSPLSVNQGFSGNLLKRLHLYNIRLSHKNWCGALSACSNLTDLKIVGCFSQMDTYQLNKVLEFLPRKCQNLSIESRSRYLYPTTSFWRNCPDLTSLSLIGFLLNDSKASLIIKDSPKLKFLTLSKSLGIIGRFLSDLRDTLVETVILRDCVSLEESNVLLFLELLLEPHFRFIRHIDVSNEHRVVSGMIHRKPKFILEKLKEKRPGLTFVADFTS